MTDYTITTDFGAKDSLPSGNAAKVIKGSEFTTEFTNILTAVNSKVDSAGDTFTGAVTFDAAVTLNADVTFDTNTMFVDVSENRVGIGNVAPATALDVTGVITTDGLTSSAGIDITGTVTASGLTVDTTTLHVDATNNRVGIGNLAPATALDVTGTVTADGLLVDGSGIFQGTSTQIDLIETDVTGNNTRLRQTVGDFFIQTVDNASANPVSRFNLDHATGDISFYEDTGTTAKFFWDASAESLGIGTTSPLKDLNISNTTGSSEIMISTSDTGTGSLEFGDVTSGAVARGFLKYNHSDNSLQLGSAQTEAMRIDSSGNVGIGTDSPATKLHVQSGGEAIRVNTANENTHMSFGGTRAMFGYARIGTSDLACIQGSAGKGIVFCTDDVTFGSGEKMRIASSGKVGIGTDSPQALLHVKNNDAGFEVDVDNQVSDGVRLLAYDRNTTTDRNMQYRANQHLFNIGTSEKMRIDASGNVGIGTSSPDYPLEVSKAGTSGTGTIGLVPDSDNGHYIRYGGSGTNNNVFRLLGTGNTERMRIDSSGNLLVGTTDQYALNGGFTVQAGTVDYISVGHASSVASGNYYAAFRHGTNTIGTITQNGTTGVLYNTSSDERLKENIADSADAGSKIDAIQIRQFDWKSDSSHQDYGVIAQELVEVAPEAVHQPEDSEDMMGVDYSKLVPMLIKEVQTLRNRVAQLENN